MTSLPFSPPPSDPQLKDVLDALKKDILLSFNCHHIGKIESFDAAKQTASVSITYSKTFFVLDAATGLYHANQVAYPLMVDCPVICLGGGNTALTFPLVAGDECLVLFNDRDLDNWFQSGAGAEVASARLHSFADGIILVGLRSSGNLLTSYDTTRAVLKNGTTFVGVSASLVKIANNQYTLNNLLQELITDVKNLVSATAAITVTCAAPGSPSGVPLNVSAINAVTTNLTATANKIAGLLE